MMMRPGRIRERHEKQKPVDFSIFIGLVHRDPHMWFIRIPTEPGSKIPQYTLFTTRVLFHLPQVELNPRT